MIRPVFLLSLPRSGSTLVQRILGSSESIATTSEPWLLLPYLYTLRAGRGGMEYSHDNAVNAIRDFFSELPEGEESYLREMRNFVLRLYEMASNEDECYFLDKTPRYHLIVEDVVRLFPDAKFILLWRNPLAIVSSIMETWAGGKWNIYHFKIDLYAGLDGLLRAYEANMEGYHAIQYEELLQNPVATIEGIARYLEIDFDQAMLEDFSKVQLGGAMGDPTGVQDYSSVSKAPLDKWKCTLANPIRKYWARRYLHWIGRERLSLMGYSLEELLAELAEIPLEYNNLLSDSARIVLGVGYCLLDLRILKRKLIQVFSRRPIYANT